MKKVFVLLLTVVLFAGCTSNPGQSISSADGEVLSAAESISQTQPEESGPISDEASSSEFVVTDVFTISNRGCVVAGDVTAGEFSVGDTIAILRGDKQIAQTTILNILIGREEAEIVRMEDSDVSILLEGIDPSLLTKGDRVVKYGSSQAYSQASSSQDDSGEKTVYTAEEMQAFFVQLEEYARTGDIRLLDHLSFEDERNYAGMKAILEDETARELWCSSFAPTVWRFPEATQNVDFSRTNYLNTYMKSPMWMDVCTLHTALSGCAPLSDTPDALKSYFAEYADVIPYHYSTRAIRYTDGTLKLEGERFVQLYISGSGGADILSKAVSDPIKSFSDFISIYEYTTDLPELNEEEKLLTEYYKLVADNRFFEAIDLMEGTSLGMQGSDTLNELVALTDEQKAKLQAELDKLPKGEFYQYSTVGAKGELGIRGVLISYGLEYNKDFDIFGEGLPIPVKEYTYCYQYRNKPSIEHFPAIYNIMKNMEL